MLYVVIQYNAGNISAFATKYAANTFTGGIVGLINGGRILDCYNTADMNGESSSSSYVGGLIGYNNTNNLIVNCYTIGNNYGKASSSDLYVGYVCGYNSSDTVNNCYYLGIENRGSGFGDSSTIHGNTVSNLKEQLTYKDFDFNDIWTMFGDGYYPFPELNSCPIDYNKKINNISIDIVPSKLTYIQNKETLNVLDGTIKVSYEYDVFETVSISKTQISGFDNTTLGTQKITISYNGFTCTFTVTIIADESTGVDPYLLGDIDGNKKINSYDALMVLQHSVGNIILTESQKNTADVNKDNVINSGDALLILQYAVGQITAFD